MLRVRTGLERAEDEDENVNRSGRNKDEARLQDSRTQTGAKERDSIGGFGNLQQLGYEGFG